MNECMISGAFSLEKACKKIIENDQIAAAFLFPITK